VQSLLIELLNKMHMQLTCTICP